MRGRTERCVQEEVNLADEHFHAFGGSANFRIVVASFLNNFVDQDVVVVRVVMEEHEFFCAAFHDNIDRFTPMAVSPAAFVRLVFFWKVLRVIDENVGTRGQLADVFVERGIAGLVIGGIDDSAFRSLQAKPHAALRVIEPLGLYCNAIAEGNFAGFQVVEVANRAHLAEINREVWGSHLFFHDLLKSAGPSGRMEDEAVGRVFVEWPEEGDALDVVPVEMRHENVSGYRLVLEFGIQLATECADSRAAIENVDGVSGANLDAGGVASITKIFRLRSRR